MRNILIGISLVLSFLMPFGAFGQEKPSMVIKTKSYTDKESLIREHGLEFLALGYEEVEPFFWKNESQKSLGELEKMFIVSVADLEKALKIAQEWNWIQYAEPLFDHQLWHIPNDSLPGFTRKQLRDLHWGHTNSKIFEAWEHSKGDTSIVMGIVDTGILTSHPSLINQMAYNLAEKFGQKGIDDDKNGIVDDTLGYDFADWDNDPTQYQEHGTQVAGIAAATVDDNFGSFGVGYHCRVMPLKVQTSRNPATLRNIYRAVTYASQNGCKIINLSLGRIGFPARHEQEIIDVLVEQYDVLIVASSGNSGKRDNVYPASYRNVLSVVHTDWLDRREQQFNSTTYSPFIDLSAPGVNLFGTSSNLSVNKGHRGNLSGSSFAAPFTSAAAGLIWAKYPKLKAAQVAQLIRATTDNTYHIRENQDFKELLGTGRLNALKALTQRDSVFSLRMVSIDIKTKNGSYVSANDTLIINPVFVNYLNTLSSPFELKCKVVSDFMTVLDTLISLNLPAAELDTLKPSRGIRVVVSPSCPAGHEALLKFEYNYKNRQDYQFHQIFVDRAGFGNILINRWAALVRENGFLSKNRANLGYQNVEMFQTAGLVLATDNKVAAAFGETDDFKPLIFADLNELYDSVYSFNSAYFAKELGIKVTQNLVGYRWEPYQDFLILEYELKNLSLNTYDTLYCGIAAQWSYSDSLEASYSQSLSSLLVSGLNTPKWLSTLKVLNPLSVYAVLDSNLIPKNDFIRQIHSPKQTFSSSSKTSFSGAKLLHFKPSQTRRVSFVLAAQNSAEQIGSALTSSIDLAQKRERKRGLPTVSDTLFCDMEKMIIEPKGGDLFSFNGYMAPQYTLAPEDTAKQIRITDLTGVFPSDTAIFNFYHKGISASFQAPPICQGNAITIEPVVVSNAHSGAVTHVIFVNGMDLSGFSSDKAGKYAVVMDAVSSKDCQAKFSDTLVIWPAPDTTVEVLGYKLRASPAASYRWFLGTELVGTDRELICKKPGFYFVELTSDEGCVSVSGNLDMRVQGIESDGNVWVYPNPFADKLVVGIDSDQIKKISLYDLSGKILLETSQSEIDARFLPKGLYYLRVQTQVKTITLNLVKP
jgi:hypothetical protein